MSKTKQSIQNIFGDLDCLNNDRTKALFSSTYINKLEVCKSEQSIKVYLEHIEDINESESVLIKNAFESKFKTTNLKIVLTLKHNLGANEVIEQYKESICKYLSIEIPSSIGILAGAEWTIDEQSIIIALRNKCADLLKLKKCDRILEGHLLEKYSIKARVLFKNACDEDAFLISHVKKIEEKQKEYINNNVIVSESKGDKGKSSNAARNSIPSVRKFDSRNKGSGSTSPLQQKGDVIFGKNFDEEIVPMAEVTQDSGKVSVKGEVFSTDTRTLKNGKVLFFFNMTDLTSSLSFKMFLTPEQYEFAKENIKNGSYLKVRAEAQYDPFQKEVSMFARDVVETKKSFRMDNAEEKRVELHLHTQMSQLDAITNVKDLIKRAAEWGHEAIAITDHGVAQAFPDAMSAAAKHGIKVIYGVEAYLIGKTYKNDDGTIDFKKSKTYHAIILVQNYTGLKNLYKIISESHLKYFHRRARVPKELLEKYREGLLLGSACEAGEVYSAILEEKSEEELESIAEYYDYLEVQPIGNNQFLINSGRLSDKQELIDINKRIIALGEKLNKKVVAACDVHFMDPEDEYFRRIIQAGQKFSDADNQAPLYLRTTEEMLNEFKYLGDEKAYEIVVKNTKYIAELVEDGILPIPKGTFPPKIEGAEEEIKTLAEGKAYEIYGDPLPEIVRSRLDKELNSIIKNGFSVMYIIAQKLVWKSVADGYLVGSRGSVGSSFVANMVGITEVNSLPAHYVCIECKYSEFIEDGSVGCGFDLPDKDCPKCGKALKKDGYDIPFETFLGFDGDKEPDIDLNFSGEYQPNAHRYTEELFGEGHVFRAGTIATVAEKTAFGYVQGYLNERDKIVTNAEKARLASGCTGIKRTTGQHPGGVMVVPHDKEIYDFCPIQRPADDTGSSIITTHFDYHSISGRILKLDILGHDDPTVIRMLQDITGIDPQAIPIGEKKTMGIFNSTEPLGVKPEDINSTVGTFAIPEFGTKFVRQMLVDTNPTTFAELIRISGLSHGTDVWLNNAQDLVRAGVTGLAEVISTRDDIMLYLIYNGLPPLTSFKIMEDVRKGKGLKPEYVELMIENKVPQWYIESCQKIKYMFPKAHAAAYVMMAFRIAWFKVHYPEAFYVTYFTVRADEFDAEIICKGKETVKSRIQELEGKGNDATQKEKNLLTILEVANEMYARGIKCLPVDLYESEAVKFKITPDGIRPPFNALQGLGDAAANNLVEAREKYSDFLSIDDLKNKAGISKSVAEIMQKHGCLEGLPESNQISLFEWFS